MQLPVGYHSFHKNAFFNYQLNRWYSLGYARKEDIVEIGSLIKSFKDYVSAFFAAAQQAQQENRLKNAATYHRAAEFLVEPSAPNKLKTYIAFLQLFNHAFSDQNFQRHKIPYQNSFLSAIKIPAKTPVSKGTIIGCGGFDSFIEEFFCIWDFFAENGYDTIAFEGPGQGGSLRLHGQLFDHDWEKPTAAVLDYFAVQDATAMGISMGGYWIMRAAAFEKRISKVIAAPPVFDWLEMTNSFNKKLVKWLMKCRPVMNFFVKMKMGIGVLRHTIHHALFIQDKTRPIEAVDWMLGMNKTHLHSESIHQDVLLLGGENDAFQPPILLQKQKEALVNAASVSYRVFTKAEHADQHCQMGNIPLLLQTMLDWLEQKQR